MKSLLAILLLGVLLQMTLAKTARKEEPEEDLSKEAKGEVVAKEDEGSVSPACGGGWWGGCHHHHGCCWRRCCHHHHHCCHHHHGCGWGWGW
ncbi:hypothetical protein AAHC03_022933 [Spirometra sp. Aus1]